MALTPEQLAAYYAAQQAYKGGGNFAYKDPTSGQTIMDAGGSGWNAGGEGALSVGDYKPGGAYNYVDSTGKDLGMQGQYGMPQGLGKDLAMYAAILGGTALAGGAFGGMFGSGALGGGSLAGDAFLPGALGVDGAAMSTAALPGLEGYLATGAAAGTSGAGSLAGDAYLPGQLGVDGSAMSTGVLPGMSQYLAPAAGTAATAGTAAKSGGLLGGASSLLGPAAAIVGGLAGAQGNKNEASSTKDIPEWMKPYVTDMFSKSQGLLNAQMSPERSQGYRDMQNAGRGLLNQPVAGNGFSLFSKR